MARYTEVLGNISSSAAGARHAIGAVAAALTPPAKTPAVAVPSEEPKKGAVETVKEMAPGLLGGAAASYLWKKHRVLGFLAGHALGANAMEILRGNRKRALAQVGVEGAGVAGALYLFKGKKPVFGWLAGVAAGTVVTSFVDGTAANDLRKKVLGR